MNLAFGGTLDVAASPAATWGALLDPAFVLATAASVRRVTPTERDRFEVVAALPLGPMAPELRFDVRLHDLAPPEAATMHCVGSGGGTRMEVTSRARLAPSPRGTTLRWDADVRLEGTATLLGRWVLEAAGRAITERFWHRLAERVAAREA